MQYQAEGVQKAARVIHRLPAITHPQDQDLLRHIAADLQVPVAVPIHQVLHQGHQDLLILRQVLHQAQDRADHRL